MLHLTAVALAAFLLAVPASAQDYTGMGHPPLGEKHWYESLCCSNRDCEPLPDGAVTQVQQGYRVRYTGKMGFSVDVVVPWKLARPSQDHRYHGCAGVDRFLCLYVPFNV